MPCGPRPKAESGHAGMRLLPGLRRECPREEAWGRASGWGAWVPLEASSCRWLPAACLTTGPSCLEPAFRASSGLPAPLSALDCPHLSPCGVWRVSPGPGPSYSLGTTGLHPWLFV